MIQNLIKHKTDVSAMSEKKHILMLLSNPFRPDPRVHKEAKSLVAAGYDVSIICWDREQNAPREEILNGIRIIRIGPKYTGLSFIRFPIMLARFWKNAFCTSTKLHADIIHAHDFDTLPLGIAISRLKNIGLVYDAHESYGMMIEGSFNSPLVGSMIDRMESSLVPYAHKIIVVSPQTHVYRGIFKAMQNKKTEQPTLVMNFLELVPLPALHERDGNIIKIGYVGVLEPGRNLLEAINAIGGMKNISFHIRGYGNLESELAAESAKYDNVFLEGRIKPDEITSFYATCDVIFNVVDIRNHHEQVGVPNRLFNSMAVGKPIMVSKESYAEEFATKNKCGFSVPSTVDGIKLGIEYVISHPKELAEMGRNGRVAFEREYNWNNAVKGLYEIYNQLLAS